MVSEYWLPHHYASLVMASSFPDVGAVAMTVARSMPQPLCQVCGPISTGGYGSLERNLELFGETIAALRMQGKHVFDQMPLEDSLLRIRASLGESYDWRGLLTDVYLPLFALGVVKTLYFIHGWESSRGARWEHDVAGRLGIARVYLPERFLLE
ncbi:DUF4406 domain-containing protein [Candidatus Woesearchaeota archaeon]|nr:DUF4406 domain-containing protein [Candidatus Woesearchaeota archaeon]